MKKSYYIQLQGKKIYYEFHASEGGQQSNRCFLLIHGFLASGYCFHRIVPLLSKKYDTYTVDLLGFGKSEKPADFEYTYESYGKILIEFIREMGLKNVILVGHSMGGQIGLQVAYLKPNLLQGIVLACSSGYIGRTEIPVKLLSYFPVRKILNWWIPRQNFRSKVIEVLKSTLYDSTLITEEMIKAYSDPIRDDGFCNTLIGLLRNREGDLEKEKLNHIKTPVLLIWGEEDQVVPLKRGIHLRMDLPNSELCVLPQAGHQVIEEKPMDVFNEIERWLNLL